MSNARTFTRNDLHAVASASDTLTEFRAFLFRRFLVWAALPESVTILGRPLDRPDANGRTSAGWGQWRLNETGAYAAPPLYAFEHWLSADHGPASITQSACVPADFIFAPEDEQDSYGEYLRLKQIFEPDT